MSEHDAEMLQFMRDLEQSIKEAHAGLGRVTTPEQMLVRMAREKSGMTQTEFAAHIHTPVSTLRDWEQGRSTTPGAVACLLRLIIRHPELLDEVRAA